MDIRKLQRAIVDGLEDVKAHNIVVFNTEHLSPLFERVIIATGTSNRQTKSLASSVRDAVKERGFPVLRTEGEANGEWIIVDCGAAVVHVMQPSIRDYYHLEEIWGDKPVNMKFGAKGGKDGEARLVKAEEPEAGRGRAAPRNAAKAHKPGGAKGARKASAEGAASPKRAPAAAARPPARKATSVKTAARRAAVATTSPTPGGAKVAAKAPARTTSRTPAKGIVTRTVGVKRVAAKAAPAGKAPAARRVPPRPAGKRAAGKSATGRSAAGKVAAKKGASRK